MKHYGDDTLTPEELDLAIGELETSINKKLEDIIIFANRVDHSSAQSLGVLSTRIQTLQTTLKIVSIGLIITMAALIYIM
jgi:hypothetical protein